MASQGPQFDIRIDAKGKMTVAITGVTSEECVKLSDMIAMIVGHESSREYTSEYRVPGTNVRITPTTTRETHSHIRTIDRPW